MNNNQSINDQTKVEAGEEKPKSNESATSVDTEEAIDVLKFVLNFKKSDGDYLTIYGGLFYWNSDDDGYFPMDQKDVYKLFLENKKKQINRK